MIDPPAHLIETVVWHLQSPHRSNAKAWQEECRRYSQWQLEHMLQEELDKLVGSDVFLELERVELDIRLPEDGQALSGWKTELRKAFRKKLDEYIRTSTDRRLPEEQLVYALEQLQRYGSWPASWPGGWQAASDMLASWRPDKRYSWIRQLIAGKPSGHNSWWQHGQMSWFRSWSEFWLASAKDLPWDVRDRLKAIGNTPFLSRVDRELLGRLFEAAIIRDGYRVELQTFAGRQVSTEKGDSPPVSNALANKPANEQPPPPTVTEHMSTANSVKYRPAEVQKLLQPDKNNPQKAADAQPASDDARAAAHSTLYTEYAGLVLLHPFLAAYFEKLGFWQSGRWQDQGRDRALQALAFLADSKSYDPGRLPLCRMLLNYADGEQALYYDCPTEVEQEADSLLRAVVSHWKVLGQSSPQALQATFLQREGLLRQDAPDGARLTVQQSGVDILISHLPWGFGTVKLPWMDHPLQVQWLH